MKTSKQNDTPTEPTALNIDAEPIQPVGEVDISYPGDEEFDPYETGLNDFNFNDNDDTE